MTFQLKKDQMGLEKDLVYLNHASIGPLPRSSHEILVNESNKQMFVGERKIDYQEIELLWKSLRSNVAKLVNGKRDGVTITTNTASGLHIVADCLFDKFKPKKNIVIPDNEFVTNSYCWQQISRRYSVELRQIKLCNHEQDYLLWEKMVDENTVLVVLSHVQFSNGYRSNLSQIIEIAHSRGSLVCVDAIQSLGAIPFEADKSDVDFVAAAGYKWILGPLGSGLLYIKPELLDELQSIMVGWFSTPNYKELSSIEFEPWSDARKFQQSMINPVLNSFNKSIQTVISWNIKDTFSSILKLQDRIINSLDQSFYQIGSSLDKEERSGILQINSLSDTKKLVDYLGSQNIVVAYRNGGIRVSPHSYNNNEDIDNLLFEIENWGKK